MTAGRQPNRRANPTLIFECAGPHYVCMYSRYADGRIGELFISTQKSNLAADTGARDAAIAFSSAVQHGADPKAIRLALCRDSYGHPSGQLGAVLDLLAEWERGP